MRRAGSISIAALACASVAVAAAGCGGGGDDAGKPAGPKTVTFAAGPDGKLAVPARVAGGVVTLRLSNASKQDADLQLVRITGNHSDSEIRKALAEGDQGRIVPWARLEGGIGTAPPGATGVATQALPGGSYLAINDNADKPVKTSFTVAGTSTGSLPPANVTVVARDYAFGISGPMKTGRNVVRFENAGRQPHHMVVLPLLPGKTLDDVRAFIGRADGKAPPFSEKGGAGTAALDGGRAQVTTLEFSKPGKYAVACFLSDRQGGPPHALKGMVSELTVR